MKTIGSALQFSGGVTLGIVASSGFELVIIFTAAVFLIVGTLIRVEAGRE